MGRRPVAALAAVVLVAEAIGIVMLNWILGLAVQHQDMSLAGLDPDVMKTSTWANGVLIGIYLVVCAFFEARCALTDQAPGRYPRIALISCAVVHAVIGAVTVGLVGWAAFALMMLTFGLVVFTLVAYGESREKAAVRETEPEPEPA